MLLLFFCIAGGLLLGSFLNVCITRLPKGESIVRPGSHCRQCGQPIANRDNIPVLSWLLLRGKCRQCKSAIAWRYPLIEVSAALLAAGCWWKLGTSWKAAAAGVLCFLLLGLAAMDAETMLLPDSFTFTGLVLGICAAGARGWTGSLLPALRQAGIAALNAAMAAFLLLLIMGLYRLTRRRAGMGMGDVKLLAMIAAWLGLPQTGLVFFLAVVTGAIYGLASIWTGRAKRRVPAGPAMIPFGTFLSIAGLYSIFLGERTLRWYLQFFA